MNRKLTDELRASLRAHAEDAPGPEPTISAVLARTVDAERSERFERSGRVRSIGLWIAAAAVVIAAVAVLNTRRGGVSHTSTAESGAPASAAAPAAGAGSAGFDQQAGSDTAGAAGGAAARAAPGHRSVPPCQPAGSTTVVSTDELAVTASGNGRQLVVVTTRCAERDGTQLGSQVGVYDAVGNEPIAMLISQAQNLHVLLVYPQGRAIVVRASSWRQGPSPGPEQGAVYDYPFVVAADGSTFSPQPAVRKALSCSRNELRVLLEPNVGIQHPSPVPDGSASTLLLTNVSGSPCAVEGYADLIVTRGDREPAALGHGPSGPAGGLLSDVAPVVLLGPGDTASAIVESAPSGATSGTAPNTSCGPVTALFAELPSVGVIWTGAAGGPAAGLPAGCSLQLHPLVAGRSGSG